MFSRLQLRHHVGRTRREVGAAGVLRLVAHVMMCRTGRRIVMDRYRVIGHNELPLRVMNKSKAAAQVLSSCLLSASNSEKDASGSCGL